MLGPVEPVPDGLLPRLDPGRRRPHPVRRRRRQRASDRRAGHAVGSGHRRRPRGRHGGGDRERVRRAALGVVARSRRLRAAGVSGARSVGRARPDGDAGRVPVARRDDDPDVPDPPRRTPQPNDQTPTILNGYGGFAITETPMWSPTIARVVRGGRPVRDRRPAGRDRARRGMAPRRAAWSASRTCSTTSTPPPTGWSSRGMTSRERLAIAGGSNGGLLVGAALTQRPDLCRAVWCGVPLLDMVRFPQFLIARLWTDEYGDPDVADDFAWLYAYSPYHHVREGEQLPGGVADHGRGRHTGRPDARPQDGGACCSRRWSTDDERARCCCIRSRGPVTVSASRSASKPTSKPTCSPSSAGSSAHLCSSRLTDARAPDGIRCRGRARRRDRPGRRGGRCLPAQSFGERAPLAAGAGSLDRVAAFDAELDLGVDGVEHPA